MLYIGLMSGTSADGIDGALVDLSDNGFRLLATRSLDYSAGIRDAIESLVRRYPDVEAAETAALHAALGADFARAAGALATEVAPGRAIAAIGSHGQTIYHGPGDRPPRTIQLADPQRIADATGVTTVGDFRSADLAAGGQGAPLAPAFHNAMFRDPGVDRLIVNIGGIANITSLPARREQPVLGFDTGPGNTLMDQWCRLQTGEPYDHDGRWASQGRADEGFVRTLLDDPYFSAPPPKSTGREYFHLAWMQARFPGWRDVRPVDLQAGLLETTARSIAGGVGGAAATSLLAGDCGELYVCGGGAYNSALMKRLQELVPARVASTGDLGLPPEWVEACAFAWLAYRRLDERPGNLPSVTGASGEVMLGEIYTPEGQESDRLLRGEG